MDDFENGTKYLRMKEEHRQAREADFRRMKRLEKEAEQAYDHEKLIGRTGELYEAKGMLEDEICEFSFFFYVEICSDLL